MNDIRDTDTTESHPAQPPLLGPQLQAARQNRNLSLEDVSNRLRISLRQLKALEADDFPALPEPTITRGFIRNYARLLEIDAEPLLTLYRKGMPQQSPRSISIHSENIAMQGGDKRHWRMYVFVSLLILALVAGWLIFTDYRAPLPALPAASPLPQAQPAVPANAVAEPKAASEPMPEAALPAAEREPQNNAVEAAPNAATEVAAAGTDTAAVAIAGASPARLKFSFGEASWLSVKDKDNKSLANKNKPAGSEESLEGQPPFKIIIGNATGSTLMYNDKAVDLGPHTKLNVVRLTLE